MSEGKSEKCEEENLRENLSGGKSGKMREERLKNTLLSKATHPFPHRGWRRLIGSPQIIFHKRATKY